MKTLSLLKPLMLVAIGSLLATSCVVRERDVIRTAPPAGVVNGEIVVTAAPPAPMVETVTVSPGPAFVWIGGNWVWHNRWVWERGHWSRPPRPGAVWVAHHYEYRNGVHVFIRGGWKF